MISIQITLESSCPFNLSRSIFFPFLFTPVNTLGIFAIIIRCQGFPIHKTQRRTIASMVCSLQDMHMWTLFNCSPSRLFPEVAQLDEIWLHMQTLSPSCNLIFCSAGQRDQRLSSCLPHPLHHSCVCNCHQDVACQQDSCVQSSLVSTQSLR